MNQDGVQNDSPSMNSEPDDGKQKQTGGANQKQTGGSKARGGKGKSKGKNKGKGKSNDNDHDNSQGSSKRTKSPLDIALASARKVTLAQTHTRSQADSLATMVETTDAWSWAKDLE